MEFNVICNKLNYLHELISKKATGSPAELAKKLGVTDRTAKSYISQLRKLGAHISYSQSTHSYFYQKPMVFKFGFEEIDDSSLNQIKGGLFNIVIQDSLYLPS
jgi:biotin operon repressor